MSDLLLALAAFQDNDANQFERSVNAGSTFTYTPIGLRRAFCGLANDTITIVGGLQQVVQSNPANSYPLATSTDQGLTWTSRQVPMSDVLSLADSGQLYVAGGAVTSSAPQYCISTSTDGITWTGRTSPFTNTGDEVYGMLWTGATFIGIAPFAPLHIATSADGITWSALKTIPAVPAGSTRTGTTGFTYANGTSYIYVVHTNQTTGVKTAHALRSADEGNTWTSAAVTLDGVAATGTIQQCGYVPRLGLFVLGVQDDSGNYHAASSTDGVAFTSRTTGIRPMTVGYDSTYVYLGGNQGTTNRLSRSTDAVSWTDLPVAAPRVSRMVNYAPRPLPAVALRASWNGVVLTGPASRATRMLRLEARLVGTSATTPWVEFTYDVNTGDGSDVLTVSAATGLEAYTLEIRGVIYYDYNEAPYYGAYPNGSAWPVTALHGAFGRIYQVRLPPPAPAVPSYSAAALADGPYAFWRLGSIITADASGNGRTLTASGTTPASVSGFAGDGDTARQWPTDPGDGPAGSYTLYYPTDSGINSANTTVTAIVKPTSGGGVILNRDNDGGQRTFQIAVSTGGELHVDAWNGLASLRSLDTSGANFLDGNAHHIAVVFRNQASPLLEEMQLFVDGVLLATDSGMFGGLYTGANQNVVIGKHVVSTDPTASGYNHYNGVLDDIAYYTVALSSTQIARQATSRSYVAPAADPPVEFTPSGYVSVPDRVLAFGFGGSNGGIASTVDGETWEDQYSGSGFILAGDYDSAHSTLLAYDLNVPDLLRSVDNGATWAVDSSLVHPFPGAMQVTSLRFANGTFVVTYDHNSSVPPTSTDYKIAFSTDDGTSWQFTNPVASAYLATAPVWTGTHWYCLVEMYTTVTSYGVFRSTDLVSWTQLASPTLLAGDTSWYLQTFLGDSWSSGPSSSFHIVYSQGTGGVFSFNGTRLIYTVDGGSTVHLLKPTFATTTQFLRNAWRNPVTGTIIGAVRSSAFLGGSVEHTTIWRSTDGGFTWSFAADFLGDDVVPELATFNPAGDTFLLAGTPTQNLYVSRDDGFTFAQLGSQPVPLANFQGSSIGGIEAVPGPGRVFFDYPLPPAIPDTARVHFLPVR